MIFFCIYTKNLFMNQKRWISDCISTAEHTLYLITCWSAMVTLHQEVIEKQHGLCSWPYLRETLIIDIPLYNFSCWNHVCTELYEKYPWHCFSEEHENTL